MEYLLALDTIRCVSFVAAPADVDATAIVWVTFGTVCCVSFAPADIDATFIVSAAVMFGAVATTGHWLDY